MWLSKLGLPDVLLENTKLKITCRKHFCFPVRKGNSLKRSGNVVLITATLPLLNDYSLDNLHKSANKDFIHTYLKGFYLNSFNHTAMCLLLSEVSKPEIVVIKHHHSWFPKVLHFRLFFASNSK